MIRLRRTAMSSDSGVSVVLLVRIVMPDVNRTDGIPFLMKTFWSESV